MVSVKVVERAATNEWEESLATIEIKWIPMAAVLLVCTEITPPELIVNSLVVSALTAVVSLIVNVYAPHEPGVRYAMLTISVTETVWVTAEAKRE
jgi:hypothetical protein